MTTILERCVAVLAPHSCIICGYENNIACDDCLFSVLESAAYPCMRCGGVTQRTGFCKVCVTGAANPCVYVCGAYDGPLAEVIHKFKFDRVGAAAEPLAAVIARQLIAIDPATIIVPVPTANKRIRIRGYDHTLLLAKALARQTGLPWASLVARRHDLRQVGSTRSTRIAQAKNAFILPRPAAVAGKHILVLDDVITTGATVLATTLALRKAGAASVSIAALARHIPR